MGGERGTGREPAVAGAHVGPTEEWKEVSGSASERPVSRKEVLSCGHGVHSRLLSLVTH